MRVNIDEIKEGGLERAWNLPRDLVDDMVKGDQAGYRAKEPGHLDLSLKKAGRRVLLSAHGQATLTAPCGRCLQPVDVKVPLDFALTFVPEEHVRPSEDGEGEASGSFEPRQADEETYSGKELDLDPVTREQLILALPPYPVCRDDCKGLCAVCGANLNERECGCDRKVPDPRWAGLEKFRK